ncbi:uncharacterized protein GGS22DRAFT_159174 [Annulohypoxylon maeteangense]|uniref:uncharacterized protein n=1 Tax=Annulohypoxylon maeteangense TaxID=1927788 RepID=UPI002008B85A|nr:uncharacterized protein GGS22DRAFT_159174 [Annulohypoxylon maeteangense]KAI0887010.1 hypothetical protein GGS22DRAFT_159174 [Annulohypoxylon maeteangense]
MTGSNTTTYNGATPPKPQHYFSRNPPTHDPTNDQNLRAYRLDKFINGPNSVPTAHVRPTHSGAASHDSTGYQAGNNGKP